MGKYASGLSYRALKMAADNNALATLSAGGFRKNKGKVQCVLTYKKADGGRGYLTHNIEGSKASGRGMTRVAEKEKFLREWRAQVVEDIKNVARVHDDPSVQTSDAVAFYIDSRDVRDESGNPVGVRLSTLTFYRYAAKRLDVLPRLASMPLKDVTENDVTEWVNAMASGQSGKAYTSKSIRDSLNILSATFRYYNLPNACKGVGVPANAAKSKRDDDGTIPNALTKDTVMRLNTLMDARESKVDGIDNVMLGARIALHTGLRGEEVTGLRWADVDLLNRWLHVRNVIERADVEVKSDDGTTKTEHREFDAKPKTTNSRRDVPIDPELHEVLTDVRARVVEMVKAEHPKMGDAGVEKLVDKMYVLTKVVRDDDGKASFVHYSPHRLGANFRDWARRVGIVGTEGPVDGVHCLRHTWATLSIQAGLPISEVSRLLGHSSITVTLNRYVGRDKDLQRQVVDTMASVFGARVPDDVGMLGVKSA